MKAGVYYNNSDVRLEELPVPEVGDNDILLKVAASGICGSDIMEWYRIKRAPLVLGHELTGEVVEAGKNVKKFTKGDRVFSTHHVPCMKCSYCLSAHQTACETFQTENNHDPGGFSEFLRVSGRSIDTGTFILPEEISFQQGSFIEPLGTAVRGLRAADLKSNESLLVLGSGIAGLLIIKLARVLGAGRIIAVDINDFRLQAAKKMGADDAVNARKDLPAFIREKNKGRLADKIMICNGALSSSAQALQSVDKGGTIVFFAVSKPGETVNIDFNPFWRNDVSIKTCYGAAPDDNLQAMELLSTGSITVDDMVTHKFSLLKIAEAFKTASEGKDCLKVIITPHE